MIESICRFIENEDRSATIERARDPNALALPAGQPDTALADAGVISIRQARDEFVQPGIACRPLDPDLIDISDRLTKRDVGCNAAVGEEDRLRYMRDLALP